MYLIIVWVYNFEVVGVYKKLDVNVDCVYVVYCKLFKDGILVELFEFMEFY